MSIKIARGPNENKLKQSKAKQSKGKGRKALTKLKQGGVKDYKHTL